MRRWQSVAPRILLRTITIRPELTANPVAYPAGYVPLDGTEPVESVYALVKQGLYVAPLRTIESIRNAFLGVKSLCASEHSMLCGVDVSRLVVAQQELLSRVLIQRDFWALEDFNDAELNRSYGTQNLYFDNYRWSQVLWKRFQQFVEEYYPLTEHTHLLYLEYEQLIRSFAAFENGVKASPLLPKSVRLHPPYGISAPSPETLEPMLLLKKWVHNFRGPLMLHRALGVQCGCGALPFGLRMCGIPIVAGTDSRPRAIQSCRQDAKQDKRLSTIKFEVAESLPPNPEGAKYDLIVVYPDEDVVQMLQSEENENIFASGFTGYLGRLEAFFDSVSDHLSDSGVIAICCTNAMSLLHPTKPHPVEFEVKVNRRFVILDYYDAKLKHAAKAKSRMLNVKLPADAQRLMRSELWILHRLDALHQFAHIHGIPGAERPALSTRWRASSSRSFRQRLLRSQESGEEWGSLKSRLTTMLQEKASNEEEDDYAEAVRMALDPEYPLELATRARAAIEARDNEEAAFHSSVVAEFKALSPREAFDLRAGLPGSIAPLP